MCVNVEHLLRVPRKKEFAAAATWTRLESHGVRQDDGCLVAKRAYEKVRFCGVMMGIHKASFMLHHNLTESPSELDDNGNPLVLRHLCNESRCFEPTHLRYGTRQENSYKDRIANGTLRTGPFSYMTWIMCSWRSKLGAGTMCEVKVPLQRNSPPAPCVQSKRSASTASI